MNSFDVVIVGAGPAGLTAGLYAGRYRMKTLILEKLSAGGQILISPTIENFPGFPGGVATDELVSRFKKQAEDTGVKLAEGEVISLAADTEGFTVTTDGDAYRTGNVILATGAGWKKLGVPGEDRLSGRGISYCATCDGPLFRNKEIAVVGGGDRALEDVILLSRYASHIYLVHRRQEFRGAEVLQEQVRALPNVTFLLDSVIEKVNGEMRVDSVEVKNIVTGGKTKLAVSGIFIFIGLSAQTAFMKGLVDTDPAGFIVTDDGMNTSRQGIYACGDCRHKSLYQVITACAEGATAAYSAHSHTLTQRKDK